MSLNPRLAAKWIEKWPSPSLNSVRMLFTEETFFCSTKSVANAFTLRILPSMAMKNAFHFVPVIVLNH